MIDTETTTPQTVTINSIGTALLNFTGAGIALTGTNPDDFEILDEFPTDPLAPGVSRQVQISFKPQEVGTRTASLLITTDDPNQPVVTITLTGQGAVYNYTRSWTRYE